MAAVPTIDEALDEAEALLKRSEAIEHPHAGKERYDAEELIASVAGHDWDPQDQIGEAALRRFRELVRKRAAGQPAAYLTGRVEFHGMSLDVRRGAFIPRQSSEFLADQAIRRLRGRPSPVHVDVATGIGPVALAVAKAVPWARVFGMDISPAAIQLAKRNAGRLGLSNATFLRGDLFAALPPRLLGGVDVVTVHPPYVPRRELRILPHEIKGFEPAESLTDFSPDGMGLLSRVVLGAPRWLHRGGWLLVEVSPDRARDVRTTLGREGFAGVRSTKGPVSVSRVVVGRA
jgi:release factor glutamine methyltransferase